MTLAAGGLFGTFLLTAGLLLLITAVFAARIPGGATFARPGIATPIRAFLLSPIHPTTWHANTAIMLGLFTGFFGAAAVFSLVSVGLSTLLAGIGVVVVALAIEGSRLVARIERRRLFIGEPVGPVAHPYRPLRGGVVDLLRAEFADEARWRDVVYVAVNLPLAFLEAVAINVAWVIAVGLLSSPIWHDLAANPGSADLLGPLAGRETPMLLLRVMGGLALLPVAASLSQVILALHRGLVRALLCTSSERELRRQVDVLRESRSAVIAAEASELHRIERDLHDGAQQRLVALTIDLGLASEHLEEDPEKARRLILDGQEQARQALAEIRDLVRGIAPSILLDRGLVAALESIAGRGPVRTTVTTNLAPGERLPAVVERTAYFVGAEALANVAKHSGAARAEVRILRDGGRLAVEVRDDGSGGATISGSGGLAGLEGRVAGVDGAFSVMSPPAGGTVVRAEIPLGASAPPQAALPQPPR